MEHVANPAEGIRRGIDELRSPASVPAGGVVKKAANLEERLQRISGLKQPAAPAAAPRPAASAQQTEFIPVEPKNFAEARLIPDEVEALILKMLLARAATGREASEQTKLPFLMIDDLLREMKARQLVVHRGSAPVNDYLFELTDLGRERARRLSEHCTYFGAAPVSLIDYIASVTAQSLTSQHPTTEDLKNAFSDLLVSQRMLARLGPAVNSGRGLFLYGAAGNGKTSIAERVTKAFGNTIWIPRAIGVDGEIIRLFDPSAHEEAPLEASSGLMSIAKVDKRWVRIRRPTIVAGGELTMDNLELTLNTSTGISEAPVQLKSNCGVLVIDDFGRQRISSQELLNRWIVPLEKRHDFLNLANGKKIQVPFDQLIIFSTNLQPKNLVDEAFLRRIAYKIEVVDPTEEEFRQLFRMMAELLEIPYNDAAVSYVIEQHYRRLDRPFRCCQPRDLMLQVRNFCHFRNCPPEMTNEFMDFAVENYFAIM